MKTIMLEVEDSYCFELLNILNKLPIKVIEDGKEHQTISSQTITKNSRFTKQEMLSKLCYQGTPVDSQAINDLVYS